MHDFLVDRRTEGIGITPIPLERGPRAPAVRKRFREAVQVSRRHAGLGVRLQFREDLSHDPVALPDFLDFLR